MNFFHGQYVFSHFEADIESGEGQTVDPVRLALIGGAGIVGQDTDGGFLLIFRQNSQQVRGKLNLLEELSRGICKAAGCVGVAVAIGDVGLDIENRRAVH